MNFHSKLDICFILFLLCTYSSTATLEVQTWLPAYHSCSLICIQDGKVNNMSMR